MFPIDIFNMFSYLLAFLNRLILEANGQRPNARAHSSQISDISTKIHLLELDFLDSK